MEFGYPVVRCKKQSHPMAATYWNFLAMLLTRSTTLSALGQNL